MPLTLEPGKYYFTVNCAKCKEQIAFAEAPSPEEKPQLKHRTISNMKCPHCGHTDRYAPALMYRAQVPEY
jgi:hypothetical protein